MCSKCMFNYRNIKPHASENKTRANWGQNIPVTTAYPEMGAKIYPHFENHSH
jgi:hypothetical protein